jgi:hypothetical protein
MTTKRKPVSRAVQRELQEATTFLFSMGKPKVDPILSAIADHEAACAAYAKPRRVVANMTPNNPRYKAAQAVQRKAGAEEMRALAALLRCRPTTLVGVLAALEHVSRPEWLATEKNYTKETVLSAVTLYEEAAVGEELSILAKSFPFRLAAALRDIIGSEGRNK